jgi:hypothetical protein
MSRQYRIRVYGKQRKDIDPALLAQVVILLGRHLHHQQQQQRSDRGAGHPKTGQEPSPSLRRGNPAASVTDSGSSAEDTPRTPEGDGPDGDIGEGLS